MFKNFNPDEVSKKIIKFIGQETHRAGFKKVIISLSGGVDSSTVAYLAVRALGQENILVALLPHKDFNHDHDAKIVIDKLQIPARNIFEIETSEIIDCFLRGLARSHLAKQGETLRKLRLGNLMARIRMTILYDLAKKHKVLVCGTENKSEYLLGYFTRFGDQASDLEPIRNLYKTQVIRLAQYLGVPKKIISKPPSAGLWQGQTDEEELGFSYQEADPILYYHFDKNCPWERIEKLGFKKEVVEKVKHQVERNKFKHEVPRVAIM